MGAAILFFTGIAIVAVWWLSQHRITAKPWLEQGVTGEAPEGAATARIGLWVLLGSLGSLFALFISAYLMRMGLADWRPVPKPVLLWINTGILMLSSGALRWAGAAAARADTRGVRTALLATGAAALAFVAGQVAAWQQLTQSGHPLASNPASSFFYVLTGLHALHLLGGLVAFAVVAARAWSDVSVRRLGPGIDLCGLYWDFLLVIWLVLFALLLVT